MPCSMQNDTHSSHIMKNVLIISGHTDMADSVANKAIMAKLAELLPTSKAVYLDRLYPDFKINAQAEQEKLIWADIIILQFPVFWFSMPSLMHRWMEDTFLHGFSHGSTGDKLRGKKLLLSYTTGAPLEALDFDAFFSGLKAACGFCGMEYAGSISTGAVSYAMRQEPGQMDAILSKAETHAQRVAQLVSQL